LLSDSLKHVFEGNEKVLVIWNIQSTSQLSDNVTVHRKLTSSGSPGRTSHVACHGGI